MMVGNRQPLLHLYLLLPDDVILLLLRQSMPLLFFGAVKCWIMIGRQHVVATIHYRWLVVEREGGRNIAGEIGDDNKQIAG